MAKHIVNGFVTYREADPWEKGPKVGFVDFNPSGTTHAWGVIVAPLAIEVEVPDGFDPRPAQIKELETERDKVRAEFAKKVKQLDDQIANLQAIAYVQEVPHVG